MPDSEYRVTVLGDPRGPWQHTMQAAFDDAIRLGLASWDESKREWFLAVPVELETKRVAAHYPPSRRDQHREPWTAEEDGKLRAMATEGEDSGVAAVRLGRSREAVSARARRLGVRLGRRAG